MILPTNLGPAPLQAREGQTGQGGWGEGLPPPLDEKIPATGYVVALSSGHGKSWLSPDIQKAKVLESGRLGP